MTFNRLYGTLQKARKGPEILFNSSVSTTCVPKELLNRSNNFVNVIQTCDGKPQRPFTAFHFKERHTSVCRHFSSKVKEKNHWDKNEDKTSRKNEATSLENKKSMELLNRSNNFVHVIQTCNGEPQRPFTAFHFKERHTSTCRHFSSKVKEKNHSDKNEDKTSRKNEATSLENKKSMVNKTEYNLINKRCNYKRRHQNLVWDRSDKRNRLNKYKITTPSKEKSKELTEEKLNNTHNTLYENSVLKSDQWSKNPKVLIAQDSSPKNILAIDIFPSSDSTIILDPPQLKTMAESNLNGSCSINTKASSAIENFHQSYSVKEAVENTKNNWKTSIDGAKSTTKDNKKTNLTLLNQNKAHMNKIVKNNINESHKQLRNVIYEDNSISLNRDCLPNVLVKKSMDNRTFKITKHSLKNKNKKEMIKGEDSSDKNIMDSKRSKSNIIESKDDLEERKSISVDVSKETVWNKRYRRKKPRLVSSEVEYHTKLQSKIQNSCKNIDLKQRYKFASSINSILRPVKSKIQIPSERCDYQLLPKNVNAPIVPSVNSTRNIAQHMNNANNCLMDNTLFLNSLKIGTSGLNEPLQNPNNNYSPQHSSEVKAPNKMELIKDINSARLNKRTLVTSLKSQIKSWKKYENLKKVIIKSTSEIYQSIRNGRKNGIITNDTVYTPREKKKEKKKIISIPLTKNYDINKCLKKTQQLLRTNYLKNNSNFTLQSDPIMILNLKYKNNYQPTFHDILKKNKILLFQEKLKKNPEILEYDIEREFNNENKTRVMENIDKELFQRNSFKNTEENDVKVFTKNAKKISLENKKPGVRYMHQLKDESKGESSEVNEINAYPSGCLKKPEFIIEALSLQDEDIKKCTEFNIGNSEPDEESLSPIPERNNAKENSETLNRENEKLENSITAEPTDKFQLGEMGKKCEDTKLNISKCVDGKGKLFAFSDMYKMKSGSIKECNNLVCDMKNVVAEKKHLNCKTHCALWNSPLDQEHCLSYESNEEMEPDVYTNELTNDSSIDEAEKTMKVVSKKLLKEQNTGKFLTETNVNNKMLNETNYDCDSINFKNTISDGNKTVVLKCDEVPNNNINVEVCSNIIYEQPIQNTCYIQKVHSEENKTAIVTDQHPKVTMSSLCFQGNESRKKNFMQQEPKLLTTAPCKQIKYMSEKPSCQDLHAIEISFDASPSQLSVSKEPKKSPDNQIEYFTKSTSSKSESKNRIELSNSCDSQHLNSCKISNTNECQSDANSNSDERFFNNIKLEQSNFDQNISGLYNHLENVTSTPPEVLSKKIDISNSPNKKGLSNKVIAPLIMFSNDEMDIKTKNLISNRGTQKSSDSDQNVEEIKNFKNSLYSFKQSNIYKDEDRTGCKLFSFLKKSYQENHRSKNSKNITLIDNIKDFFRISFNYFKFDNTDDQVLMNNIISNSYHSKTKHNTNDASASFKETNLSIENPGYSTKSDKEEISSKYGEMDFHQKEINKNMGATKNKLSSYLLRHSREDKSLTGNEEFQRKFCNMFPVSPKHEFPKTSKELEHMFIPNEEISINNLNRGVEENITFQKRTISSNIDHITGKNNHHSSFLNNVNEKQFENISVSQVKQQASFCNLNHKKSYMKFSLKNRLYNRKPKQRLGKADMINIKNKHREYHYSMDSNVPLAEIPNSVKIRGNKRNELIPLKWSIGSKPTVKYRTKLKKGHSFKLYLDDKMKKETNLLKTLKSFEKLSDYSNPESGWLNCFSKNNYSDNKFSSNDFLTYIKKRKLSKKSPLNF